MTTTEIKTAYHGKRRLKDQALRNMRKHAAEDRLIQGAYETSSGKNWKGCSVGCMARGRTRTMLKRSGETSREQLTYLQHSTLARDYGIPEGLIWLNDVLFEHLPLVEAKKWPVSFLNAIRVGSDLSHVFGTLETFARARFGTIPSYTSGWFARAQSLVWDCIPRSASKAVKRKSVLALRDEFLRLLRTAPMVKQ